MRRMQRGVSVSVRVRVSVSVSAGVRAGACVSLSPLRAHHCTRQEHEGAQAREDRNVGSYGFHCLIQGLASIAISARSRGDAPKPWRSSRGSTSAAKPARATRRAESVDLHQAGGEVLGAIQNRGMPSRTRASTRIARQSPLARGGAASCGEASEAAVDRRCTVWGQCSWPERELGSPLPRSAGTAGSVAAARACASP